MKHCNTCGIDVQGKGEKCPLCGHKMTGEATESLYPELPSFFKKFEKIIKIMMLVTISIVVISAAINILMPETGHWALFVFIGVICFWISFIICVKKKNSIPQNIAIQAIITALLCALWDYVTGWRNWSVDYAIPLIFSVAVISMMIIVKILKIPPSDYLFSLISCIFFGIISVILCITGVVSLIIPSVICVGVCILTLSFLIIFEWNDFWSVLKRKFHI